jgi:predicted nucleic acid-binding protein
MTRLMLDTSAYAAFMRGVEPAKHALQHADEICLNPLRRAGTPIPTHDIWIAATAMQYGLRVLTADRHYLKVSQVIVDYLEV